MAWYDPFGIMKSFSNPGKGYEKAGQEYKKAWGEAKGYETPYWQAGLDQTSNLTEMQKLLSNPAELQSQWASTYETSPYAKQLQDQAMTSGLEEAARMGLTGSSSALQSLQNNSTNIMQRDRENYMDDLMKKYLTSIGISQDIYGKGAQMGGELGRQTMNYGSDMADLAYNKENANRNMWLDLLKMGTQAATVAAML